MPMNTSWLVGLMSADTMPITWPSRLTSGPPELPGLTAASTWIRPCSSGPLLGSWNDRFSPETTPTLIELDIPNGLPMTKTSLPTRTLRGLPRTAGWRLAGGWLARRTAMSFWGCVVWTWAGECVPSANVTSIDTAFATTCKAVRMSPLESTTTPLPRVPLAVEAPVPKPLAPAVGAPAASWVSIATSEGWTAWYAVCDRAGAGVTEASAWATLVATSCCVRGRGPGLAAPYNSTATNTANAVAANGAAERTRRRMRPNSRVQGRPAGDPGPSGNGARTGSSVSLSAWGFCAQVHKLG